MSGPKFFRLSDVSVIDVTGADAATIVNNVTTNEVLSLPASIGRETFVTDVRGKTLGHVVLIKQTDSIRIFGAAGQSNTIAEHIDRYTIREDSTPQIRDAEFCAIVLSDDAFQACGFPHGAAESNDRESIAHFTVPIANNDIDAYLTRWLGRGTVVLLVEKPDCETVEQQLTELSLTRGTESDFHHCRIDAGYPWYGIDLDASNLPQELDRDTDAISFTKGCYLGQETVARLDALGQVQRKLVRWKIDGACPPPGTILEAADKKVGRLTSVTACADGEALALGYARRSHFDSGAAANGTHSDSGAEFKATVR